MDTITFSSDDVSIGRVHHLVSTNAHTTEDKITVFFAHANGLLGQIWNQFALELISLGNYDCWAIDFRGHGQSTIEEGYDFPWEQFGKDVVACLEYLIENEYIDSEVTRYGFGHSMGASSLLFSQLFSPQLFTGLYCFEPVIFPTPYVELVKNNNPLIEMTLRRTQTFDSYEAAFKNFAVKRPFSLFEKKTLQTYVKEGFKQNNDGSVSLVCERENEAQIYQSGALHCLYVHLDEIKCPTHIAVGEKDIKNIGPGFFAKEIAEKIPNATYTIYPEFGHFGPLENPKFFAQDLHEQIFTMSV